ncbi:MAG: nickel-responsive transcriptional regulator NikR [Alphaproteobacteria bacterium]|nr:nickel-responsive transcriptional regulator NikR [Alphaproteobacteria bacterium]
MSKVARLPISLEDSLLDQFESYRTAHGYPSRSEAITSLMRKAFVEEEWQRGKDVAGTISIVYDHHKRGTINKLVNVQHDFGNLIVCTQHIHLDHHNCMEVVVVRGRAAEIRKLLTRLKSVKGIKHSSLMMATTGKHVE